MAFAFGLGQICHFLSPLKINMEHNHGGLFQIIFLYTWVISRFHVNLPGCKFVNILGVAWNLQACASWSVFFEDAGMRCQTNTTIQPKFQE